MSTAETQSVYDDQQRDRIRQALQRYMAQHRIGVPRLCKRITEADKRRRVLDVKTLQRFLGGVGRTLDMYVDMCRIFLDSVGESTAPEFGEALCGFLLEPMTAADREAITRRLTEDFAGTFETTTLSTAGKGGIPHSSETPFSKSVVEFAPVPSQAHLNVREFVQDEHKSDLSPHRRYAYEGVLVARPPLVHIVLRSSLTHHPKVYFLRQQERPGPSGASGWLEGRGVESVFMGPAASYGPSDRTFHVRFDKVKKSG